MVLKKLCWDANTCNAVALTKQRNLYQSGQTFLCLKVPVCYLHQSIIYFIPCDQIVQSLLNNSVKPLKSFYENEAWVNFVMIGMHVGELIENSKVLPKI